MLIVQVCLDFNAKRLWLPVISLLAAFGMRGREINLACLFANQNVNSLLVTNMHSYPLYCSMLLVSFGNLLESSFSDYKFIVMLIHMGRKYDMYLN